MNAASIISVGEYQALGPFFHGYGGVGLICGAVDA